MIFTYTEQRMDIVDPPLRPPQAPPHSQAFGKKQQKSLGFFFVLFFWQGLYLNIEHWVLNIESLGVKTGTRVEREKGGWRWKLELKSTG